MLNNRGKQKRVGDMVNCPSEAEAANRKHQGDEKGASLPARAMKFRMWGPQVTQQVAMRPRADNGRMA